MKNEVIKKYGIVTSIAIVIAVVVVAISIAKSNSPVMVTVQNTTQSTATPNASQSSAKVVQNVVANTVPSTPTVVKNPVPAPSSNNSYISYLNQLYTSQNSCKAAATGQYDDLYSGSLQQSAFQSYLNTSSGLCYMKVTGTIHPQYSASSTAVMYLRSVSSDSMLAECTDSIGHTFADSEWACSDKVAGQPISMAAFNALIYKYTVQ